MSEDRAFAAKLAAILDRPRAEAPGADQFEAAQHHFAACLSDAIDAALAESAGVEPRFAMLAPVLRRELTALGNRLATQSAMADPDSFRRWAADLIESTLTAGHDGRRDPALDAYVVDPYAIWRRRLKRAQWVLGAAALLAFLAYLATRR